MVPLLRQEIFIKHPPWFSARELAPCLSLLENGQENPMRWPENSLMPGEQGRTRSQATLGQRTRLKEDSPEGPTCVLNPCNCSVGKERSRRKRGEDSREQETRAGGPGRREQVVEDAWWQSRHSWTRKSPSAILRDLSFILKDKARPWRILNKPTP